MYATIEYVEREFFKFNKKIFGGTLEPLPIKLSSARTFLGKLCYSRKRYLFCGTKYGDFVLVISDKRDMDEDLLQDTIIHEMIHYYILSNQMKDSSAHGVIFRKMMNDINARYGRNVTISHRASNEERENDTEVRKHLICISEFEDGRVGITLAAQTKVFFLWHEIPKFPGVKDCRWYMSQNPYFNRFRRSTTVKIYLVENVDEVKMQLQDSVPLVKDGNIIRCK